MIEKWFDSSQNHYRSNLSLRFIEEAIKIGCIIFKEIVPSMLFLCKTMLSVPYSSKLFWQNKRKTVFKLQ